MCIEVWLLRDITHPPLVGNQVILNRRTLKKNVAEGHLDQAGDHFHCGGLAGTVGPKVAGNFARAGAETDVVNGSNTREMLGNVAQLKHGAPASVRHREEWECSRDLARLSRQGLSNVWWRESSDRSSNAGGRRELRWRRREAPAARLLFPPSDEVSFLRK